MKKTSQLPKIPAVIQVGVRKGTSGVLLAKLSKFDVFTEANNLNDLIFQVNDLIYTYFDIPKKYQSDIFFMPPKNTHLELIKIANESTPTTFSQFRVKSLYAPHLLEHMKQMHFA